MSLHACLALVALALLPDPARAAVPERVWGTYLGGEDIDQLVSVAVSATGHVYACGYSRSTTGIATPGAYKQVAGTYDAILVKFTPDGERVWGTYFGGASNENCRGLAVDADERILMTGTTASTDAIATPGALVDAWNDQSNGFAAQFDADGQRLWATYLPGKGYDAVAAIGADGSRLIAGSVASPLPFDPPNAHQPAPGGNYDAYLLALSPDGALLWGTYLGGSGADGRGVSLAAGALGVTLALTTTSPGLATPGVHQEMLGGSQDAVVVRFTDDGTRVWSTYFGGPNVEGQGNFVTTAVAPDGGAWVVTNTQSPVDIAGPGAYQATLQGARDLAVVRFDADGKRVWSTYLGGTDSEGAGAIAVDAAGHGLVAFATTSAGLATPDALQTAVNGEYDNVLHRFDPAGNRIWASYYGGPGSDFAFPGALAHDGLGTFYLAEYTSSTSLVATPDAHQPAFGGGLGDGFLARFAAGFGMPCASDAACETNLCVDGVCCDKPCGGDDDGDCQACSVAAGAALDGLCGPLAAATVCRPAAAACDALEVCSGDAVTCPADADATDGTPCDGGACQAGMCVPDEPASTGEPNTGDPGTGTGDADTGSTTADIGETGTSTGDAGTSAADAGTSSSSPPTTGDAPDTTGDPPDVTTTTAADPPAQDDGGCGCAASPVPQDMSFGLLALLALRRARRPRRDPRAHLPGASR